MSGEFTAHTLGPLFDGALESAIEQGIDEAQLEVAERGQTLVRQKLGDVLKHPTGHYSSRVLVQPLEDPRIVVSGVVYDRWIEGTGSRNKTTRFKGYFVFRQTRDRLEREAPDIASDVIMRRIGRL